MSVDFVVVVVVVVFAYLVAFLPPLYRSLYHRKVLYVRSRSQAYFNKQAHERRETLRQHFLGMPLKLQILNF